MPYHYLEANPSPRFKEKGKFEGKYLVNVDQLASAVGIGSRAIFFFIALHVVILGLHVHASVCLRWDWDSPGRPSISQRGRVRNPVDFEIRETSFSSYRKGRGVLDGSGDLSTWTSRDKGALAPMPCTSDLLLAPQGEWERQGWCLEGVVWCVKWDRHRKEFRKNKS